MDGRTRCSAVHCHAPGPRRFHAGPLGCVLLLLVLLLALPLPALPLQAQESEPLAQVDAILEGMSPEERVGQLFLVAFVGNDVGPGSDVARLVREELVGGVVYLASNSNFYNAPDTPRQVAELSNALQALAMERGTQIPLFVAIDHEGDGYPYTRITGGVTPLPNAMAIGATWDTNNARDVGQMVGRELAAMGINLLLGPGVDVLAQPRAGGQGDIGTRTFGGDPWWVGQMGRAYVEGVHSGSGGRVATVAKHFPGHGGSDRLPDEEVSTVDKSLEELASVELVPFLALTREDGAPAAVTDALMTSHIRYRGVQGNVRQFTAPLSFDAEGMSAILALDGLREWYETGLMVSDSLGVPAVRRYFDPTLATFPHRRIAREALLAGNDVLLLAQFDLGDAWEGQVRNVRDTVAFFVEEYGRDAAFAARVDDAVRRILYAKLKLYPEFRREAVQVHPEVALEVCGLGNQVTQGIADRAVTLLYPDATALPAPPRRGDKILIVTDARQVRECFAARCLPFSPLGLTAVQDAILLIYGPHGTGQVDAGDITSLPFGQLKAFLAGDPTDYDVGGLLQQADWVLFAQQDLNPVKGPNSDAVQLFLDDPRSSSYRARLVVLAFNAPYNLDTTQVSKLSLYLGLYSKTDAFVKAAVRALFGELRPRGAPPVDVAGTNYDLQRQLNPDPSQVLSLVLREPAAGGLLVPPVLARLEAGPIVDRNGNTVPDGTPVTFFAEYLDGTYLPPQHATTVAGVAAAELALLGPGTVLLRAESGNAHNSGMLELRLQYPATSTPPPTDTQAPEPTALAPTATATVEPTSVPLPTLAVEPEHPDPPPGAAARVSELLLGLGVTGAAATSGSLLAGRRGGGRPGAVRRALLGIIGGMSGYLLYILGAIRPESWGVLPEAAWLPAAGLALVVAAGALLGMLLMPPARGAS
jgi:beta-N-acetylhexosaminidase